MGGGGLMLSCLTGAIIWWPGVKHWRRSWQVSWRASFPRINWDLHSAFGIWSFPFVLLWGISGFYFAFPQVFSIFFVLDPGDRITDQWLFCFRSYTLGDLRGLRSRFGRSWVWCRVFWHSQVRSFAAAG
jgi:hypothetical protein